MTEARRKYLKDNAEQIRLSRKRYNDTHKAQNSAQCKVWHARNKEKRKAAYLASDKTERNRKRRAYKALRRATDADFKVTENLRRRIWGALKRLGASHRKCNKTAELLGCSIPDFRIYLESRFEPGMSWENYGSGWQVDHIMPCAIFDLSKPEHQHRCFHFSNMQPLWAHENRVKRDKTTFKAQL